MWQEFTSGRRSEEDLAIPILLAAELRPTQTVAEHNLAFLDGG